MQNLLLRERHFVQLPQPYLSLTLTLFLILAPNLNHRLLSQTLGWWTFATVLHGH